MNKTKFIPPSPLNTAVLFLVFNRLDTAKQVFEAIRKAKPPKLYIAADGARKDRPGEGIEVQKVRDYIIDNIDWDCDIRTLFRENNLGCKMAVSSAIDWFFENEEMGIILEDDCLPSQSFFWYCEELLEKYKYDERIFLISGYNKQNQWYKGKNDYLFSNFGGIWGWASWKRAWKHFDLNMSDINEFIKENNFENLLGKKTGKLRQKQLLSVIKRDIDTWDFPWGYARHKNNGLACVPTVSLIENIGFGKAATHTFGENKDGVKKHEMQFPLSENKFFIPDRYYDMKFHNSISFYNRIKNKLKSLAHKILTQLVRRD